MRRNRLRDPRSGDRDDAHDAVRRETLLAARRIMMMAGFALLAASIWAFCTLDMNSSLWAFRPLLFFVGVAMALVMVPSQTATFESVSLHDTAHASSLFSTMRRFASAAGVAVMSTVLTRRISANVANPDPQSSPLAQVEAVFVGRDRTFIVSAMVAVAGMGVVFAFRMTSGTIVPASSAIGEEGDLAGWPSVSITHRA